MSTVEQDTIRDNHAEAMAATISDPRITNSDALDIASDALAALETVLLDKETIERVAKALWDTDKFAHAPEWEDYILVSERCEKYRKQARTALLTALGVSDDGS